MDYQTFNSQQHLPHAFAGQFSNPSAAHLAQPTTHSPQQQHQLYADPQARFAQSNPSFSYAHFPNGQAGGFPSSMGANASSSGAMMQPGGGLSHTQIHQARAAAFQQQQQQQQHQHQQQQQQQQQQQHHQHQHPHQQLASPSPYSSAPFSQPLASPAHPQFAQNRNTASPSAASNPSYSTPQRQHSPNTLPSNSQQQPMAAPGAQLQGSQPSQASTPVRNVPQSPVSPVAQAREKDRMSTLLDINNLLIKEVCELQSQGKAGGQSGPSPEGKAEGDKQPPTKEYVDCMRRLQANLAYLAQNAEKNHKPNQAIMQGPAIMSTPAPSEELTKLYTKLQSLFPGWRGQSNQMKASPGPQRLGSTSSQPNSAGPHKNNGNSMQPPNSAGLPPNMQLPSNANAVGGMNMGMNMNMNMMNSMGNNMAGMGGQMMGSNNFMGHDQQHPQQQQQPPPPPPPHH